MSIEAEPITPREYQLMVDALPANAILSQTHNPDGTRDEVYTDPNGRTLLSAHVNTMGREISDVLIGQKETGPLPLRVKEALRLQR